MPTTSRLALRLAYLGGGFVGWQRQPAGRSVQGELEVALARLYGRPVAAVGAGRTDAGVHATGQVAHFDAPRPIPPRGVLLALNGALPADVRVLAARAVPSTFHARHSARGKLYRYRLALGPALDPWLELRAYRLDLALDLEPMRAAAALCEGTHDFAAFASSGHAGTGRRGTRRSLARVALRGGGRRLDVLLEGDGFLRNMARRIAGALIEVGRGAQPAGWVGALLADPASRPAAPTAPAHGLTLERVLYV